MPDATIRYLIADDHTVFRQGLRLVLADDSRLELAGEAADGEQLLEMLKYEQPDVVLLDLKMPGMDGLSATREIRLRFPQVKVLILTMHDDEQLMLHLLEAGAHGYLVKNANADEIKLALRACVENGCYINQRTGKLVLENIARRKPGDARFRTGVVINDRERDVLRLICEGMTAAEIGKAIFLSPRTVEGIKASLLEKIGVRNVAGLVLYAVRMGIVN